MRLENKQVNNIMDNLLDVEKYTEGRVEYDSKNKVGVIHKSLMYPVQLKTYRYQQFQDKLLRTKGYKCVFRVLNLKEQLLRVQTIKTGKVVSNKQIDIILKLIMQKPVNYQECEQYLKICNEYPKLVETEVFKVINYWMQFVIKKQGVLKFNEE